MERRGEYVDWTLEIVQRCQGTNPPLEAHYFRTYRRFMKALDPENPDAE